MRWRLGIAGFCLGLIPSHALAGDGAREPAALGRGATHAVDSCSECDFVIEPGTTSATGTELGVEPGDLVCVRGGARPFLRLYDFVGTEAAPIVITNCEGAVEIDNADRGYGLTGEGMAHVQVSGTGDADIEYGFSVRATREGPDYSASGVVFNGRSTNYELDHFEVFDSGFAGFNLKTEPTCDLGANLGNFTQYETHLHHNYVHDTGGEGMYLGSTGYGGRVYTCDGIETTLYPHEHRGFYIHHNLVENTGWDGAQIGVTPENCEFHHNVVRNVGLKNEDVQANGLQIGGASACEVWANRLENGPTNGMIVLDARDTFIHDNVVVGFETAMYVNDRGTQEVAGSRYVLVHNTIAQIGAEGITMFGALSVGNVVKNNFFVDVGVSILNVGNDVDWTFDGNLSSDPSSAHFVDFDGRNFELTVESSAVDHGVDIAPIPITPDFRGVERDGMPDAGAYEWTENPPPAEGGEDGGGDGATSDEGSAETSSGWTVGADDGAGGDDASGCACVVGNASRRDRAVPLALIVLGGGWLRRRHSKPLARRRD